MCPNIAMVEHNNTHVSAIFHKTYYTLLTIFTLLAIFHTPYCTFTFRTIFHKYPCRHLKPYFSTLSLLAIFHTTYCTLLTLFHRAYCTSLTIFHTAYFCTLLTQTVDLAWQTSLPLLIRCWTQTFAHTQRWTELHLVHFYLYYTQDSVYCKWQTTLTSCETVTENPFSCINATQCMSCPHKSCAQKHSGHNFIVLLCSYCLRFFYLTSPLYPTG